MQLNQLLKLIFFVPFLLLLSRCNNGSSSGEINIAVAANMKVPLDSIVKVYELKTGTKCQLFSNSSGTLNSQIIQGAPYDIFLSANKKYPEHLYDKGIVEEPVVYGMGSLVLVYRANSSLNDLISVLTDKQIKKIAVAFPENAPYGTAGMEVLKSLNLSETIKDKMVIGESVGQVNQLFASNGVDAAFTSYSFVKSYSESFDFLAIEDSLYSPIEQSGAIIKRDSPEKLTLQQEFMAFLASKECLDILRFYGYKTDF